MLFFVAFMIIVEAKSGSEMQVFNTHLLIDNLFINVFFNRYLMSESVAKMF